MLLHFSRFNTESGRILQSGTIQKELFDPLYMIEGQYNDTLYYIVDGTPIQRPVFVLPKSEIFANGVDSIVVSGLPIPFVVDIDGEEIEINDGVFDFCHTIPGTYTITPRTFPYQSKPIEVVVS